MSETDYKAVVTEMELSPDPRWMPSQDTLLQDDYLGKSIQILWEQGWKVVSIQSIEENRMMVLLERDTVQV
jgi:hypothetical protein